MTRLDQIKQRWTKARAWLKSILPSSSFGAAYQSVELQKLLDDLDWLMAELEKKNASNNSKRPGIVDKQ